MTHSNLAIVVPAYKVAYLAQTFECIAQQHCRDFNLYVFDDASHASIKQLYDKYFGTWSNAMFHRFDQNMGEADLVGHWNRCLELVGDEDWVWLFSDDDLMSADCVEVIKATLQQSEAQSCDVLRFPIQLIDEEGRNIGSPAVFEHNYTSAEFLSVRSYGKVWSALQEFVFRRSKLTEVGGLVNFDLAWWSDVATVGLVAEPGRIYQMRQGVVSWRKGQANITVRNSDDILRRKYDATIKYYNWLHDFSHKKNLKPQIARYARYLWYILLPDIPGCMSRWHNMLHLATQLHDVKRLSDKMYLLLIYGISRVRHKV